MNKANDKKKLLANDDHAPIELATIALNNKKSNDLWLITGKDIGTRTEQINDKDVHTQSELTTIRSDDIGTNDGRKMTGEKSKIGNRSLPIFDKLSVNLNKEDALDQNQSVVLVADNPMTRNHRIVEAVTKEPTMTTTNIVNKIEPNFSSIIGYAEEPLLPLSEACFPMNNILHNLPFYIKMALDETPTEPPDGLNIDESAAIRLYTIEWDEPHQSLYSMLNHALRNTNHEELRPYFKYMKLFLTALAKLPCFPPVTVWRGVPRNVSADFPRGTSVTWWAFSSCTTELTVLENHVYLGDIGDRTLFSVEVINARTIRAHSHFATEDEILLLPGTRMIVQSQFTPAPDLHIIHLRQVIPKEVLLEPPFEGACLYPKTDPAKRPWYYKKSFIIPICSLIFLLIVALIIIGIVLGIRSKNNSTGNLLSANRSMCQPRQFNGLSAEILWSFDCQNANDDRSNTTEYDGIAVNNPSYITPDYSGQGYTVSLNRQLEQYITLPQHMIPTLKSLTVSAWIYVDAEPNVYLLYKTILARCADQNNSSKCIVCGIFLDPVKRGQFLQFRVGNDIIVGTTALTALNWQHVAYVFDSNTLTQKIYLNGLLESANSTSEPYNFISTSVGMTIGKDYIDDDYYYSGLIDQLAFSFHGKNSSEVLEEATLLAHYQFESSTTLNNDSGPNAIVAQVQNASFDITSGSLLLNTTSSYFRATGFVLPASNIHNNSYSFSFWFKTSIFDVNGYTPTPIARISLSNSISGQISQGSETCLTMLVHQHGSLWLNQVSNDASGIIYYTNNTFQFDQFNHMGVIFNNSNGTVSFFVNGILAGSYSNPNLGNQISAGSRVALTLGNTMDEKFYELCNIAIAIDFKYHFLVFEGAIDDVRFYSRVLTNDEIQLSASARL